MKKAPNQLKVTRPHKSNLIKGRKGENFKLYTVGIRLKDTCYISYNQLEASRKALSRLVKPKEVKNRKNLKIILSIRKKKKNRGRLRQAGRKKKVLLIRSNLCVVLSKKPLQVRMGKGKGAVDRHVYHARKNRMLMEISTQRFKLRKIHRLFNASAIKLPKKVRLVYNKGSLRRETQHSRSPSSLILLKKLYLKHA